MARTTNTTTATAQQKYEMLLWLTCMSIIHDGNLSQLLCISNKSPKKKCDVCGGYLNPFNFVSAPTL